MSLNLELFINSGFFYEKQVNIPIDFNYLNTDICCVINS